MFRWSKTFTEAYAMLKEVCGNKCLSRTQVFEWFKRFKEGRESTEDDPRPGRPSTSIENIEKTILHESVNMRKVCAKMVPKLLTATKVLNQLTEADFQHWRSRMERCRDRQGEYIEGEKVATVIGNE
ncbi:hypothetical protein NQ318_013880 [Aromia moschata]|uniref:Mos1 transposase HTH domain-containing protein n=1 Tax=Aromia moschata TaxID=1265417 RepID=A0AAV8ZAF0_9CUCU|nr:hypothetical protein NQ318_013880 [Aromia moschata]